MENKNTFKEQHILNIAEQTFEEYGFRETTIRLITFKAGINISMLHYYFRSKEKLFELVLERKITQFDAQKQLVSPAINPLEELLGYIGIYARMIAENRKFYRLILTELLVRGEEASGNIIRRFFTSNKQTLQSILEKGIGTGFFRPMDVNLAVVTIFGTLTNSLLHPVGPSNQAGSEDDEKLLQHFRDVFTGFIKK